MFFMFIGVVSSVLTASVTLHPGSLPTPATLNLSCANYHATAPFEVQPRNGSTFVIGCTSVNVTLSAKRATVPCAKGGSVRSLVSPPPSLLALLTKPNMPKHPRLLLPAFTPRFRLDFLYNLPNRTDTSRPVQPTQAADPRCTPFDIPPQSGSSTYRLLAPNDAESPGQVDLVARSSAQRAWCEQVAADAVSLRCSRPLSLLVPPANATVVSSAASSVSVPPACGTPGGTAVAAATDAARFIVDATFDDPVEVTVCPEVESAEEEDAGELVLYGRDPLCGCLALPVRRGDRGCIIAKIADVQTAVLLSVAQTNSTSARRVTVTAMGAPCADECVYHPLTVTNYPQLTCTDRYVARLRNDRSHKAGMCGSQGELHVAELVYFSAPRDDDYTFTTCSTGYVDRTRMLITDVACNCVGAADSTACDLPALTDIFSEPVRAEANEEQARWLANVVADLVDGEGEGDAEGDAEGEGEGDAEGDAEAEGEGEGEGESEDDDGGWPGNLCDLPATCATTTVRLAADETVVVRLTAAQADLTSTEQQVALRVTSAGCAEECSAEGVWCDSLSRQGWTDIVNGRPSPYVASAPVSSRLSVAVLLAAGARVAGAFTGAAY